MSIGHPTPRELQRLYEQGTNITEYLRHVQGLSENTRPIIEIAYELQSGSYVRAMQNPDYASIKNRYAHAIAERIGKLGDFTSLLEAGVGEATTLAPLLQRLDGQPKVYGFDLSWSRVAQARAWLDESGFSGGTLCTGDLLSIPFRDSSIDIVYTSHAIEPNGGAEAAILKELYRVARRYVVLLEPGYELAHESARARMDSHGYCRGLAETARRLGFQLVEHSLFPVSLNPENPTALTVIRKPHGVADDTRSPLACPIHKTPLVEASGVLYSPEGLCAYPVIGGIPCLREGNAVLASQYLEFV